MSSDKQSVLVVGAAGRTGRSIVNALIKAGSFTLIAGVRPASIEKPEVVQLSRHGVEIRQADIGSDSQEQLLKLLDRINILILTVSVYTDQEPILRAAKEVRSIQRVIPSDWATAAPPGVLETHDVKLSIRQLIQELELPFTFVQVGWWLELSFPTSHEHKDHPFAQVFNVNINSNKPFLITVLSNIGEFVRRILQDPRTLNTTVTTWDYVSNKNEAWRIAGKLTGEDLSDYPTLTAEEIEDIINKSSHPPLKFFGQYAQSLFIRGDNTLENAKAAGSLDARELYPDYQPSLSLEAAAKANFYDVPFPPVPVEMPDRW